MVPLLQKGSQEESVIQDDRPNKAEAGGQTLLTSHDGAELVLASVLKHQSSFSKQGFSV